ncbi:MAG: lysoplasmalogenase family protein [Candidatus Thorarchaeota archaeon]
MASSSFKTPIGILRLLIVLAVLAIVVLVQVFTGFFEPNPNWLFLSGSAMIVALALLNYVEMKTRFVMFMFVAMAVCFLADLLMASVFYLIPAEESIRNLINGVPIFLIGHVIYLLALRNRSPLFLRSESPKLIMRNLIIWIVSIAAVFVLFFFTLYNPTNLVVSIGLFVYGIFLTSSLVFSITKWFDDFPQFFSLSLIFGFLLFFISDYILGYKILVGNVFPGIEAVGITYLLGQLLIHLSPKLENV